MTSGFTIELNTVTSHRRPTLISSLTSESDSESACVFGVAALLLPCFGFGLGLGLCFRNGFDQPRLPSFFARAAGFALPTSADPTRSDAAATAATSATGAAAFAFPFFVSSSLALSDDSGSDSSCWLSVGSIGLGPFFWNGFPE